jgi:hypothetical protein
MGQELAGSTLIIHPSSAGHAGNSSLPHLSSFPASSADENHATFKNMLINILLGLFFHQSIPFTNIFSIFEILFHHKVRNNKLYL